MTFLKVPHVVACTIAIPMYRVSIPDVLPLANVRWTPITVTVIPCQTLRAPNSLIDKGRRDSLYISILRGMTIAPINEGVLPYPNKY
jgi:hypothetical protein